MKKILTKSKFSIYHFRNGKRIEGLHEHLSGDVTGIEGDATGIRGDATGIRGSVNGIEGDLDDAQITSEERQKGINIKDLIK